MRRGFTTVAISSAGVYCSTVFTEEVTLRGHPGSCQHTQSSFRNNPLHGADAERPATLLLFLRISFLPEGEDQEKDGGGGLYLTTLLIYY